MNIYPYGQCTWWCANEEPWCQRFGNLGNARDWASNWRKRRGFVQMTPAVGTVACFQPGSNGADSVYGHVAVVIAATDAAFTVSEMNGPAGPGRTDDRGCTDNAGVSFLRQFTPTPNTGDPDEMALYQRKNGTTYYIAGGTLVQLGSGPDIQYLVGLGAKIILEADLTVAAATNFNNLPVV